MFDINLESFIQRGKIMIDRIKMEYRNVSEEDILLYRVVRQK
jgi:hypothetical protein